MMTILPFQHVPGGAIEAGGIYVQAALNGRHGTLNLDTGAWLMQLGSNHWTRHPDSTLDTLRDARAADPDTSQDGAARVETIQFGTLPPHHLDLTDVQTVNGFYGGENPLRENVNVNFGEWDPHMAGGKAVLGDLGLVDLVPYETIIDYQHQRLILIRLDTTGRRLAPVPTFTVVDSVPLQPPFCWLHIKVRVGDVEKNLVLDTGTPISNVLDTRGGFSPTLDTLRIGTRVFPAVSFSLDGGVHPQIERYNISGILGGPSLRQIGVFGINLRTHYLLFYAESAGVRVPAASPR
ncbi:MAG TPA: hypothetical protein VNU46_03165 [Gemmatimonadaceae bacterium]|nr:hypothetical protein [Gemmatimonadaceae bacterium]